MLKFSSIVIEELASGGKRQVTRNQIFYLMGFILGGILFGIANGGTVMTSALLFGSLSPLMTCISLIGSGILALSWAFLYAKPIGPALIKAFSNSTQQNARIKVKSRFEKDIKKLTWFTQSLKTAKTSDILASDIWILNIQLHYLIIAATYNALRSYEKYQKAGPLMRKLFFRKEPVLIDHEHSNIPMQFADLKCAKAQQAISLYKILEKHSKKSLIFDTPTIEFKNEKQLSAKEYLDQALIKFQNFSKNKPSLLSKNAYNTIFFKYLRKLRKPNLLQILAVKITTFIAQINALTVVAFSMFLGGISLVTSLYQSICSLFALSPILSPSLSWVIGGLFSLGGFSGAWFLTQSTVIKATKNYFKSKRQLTIPDEINAKKAYDSALYNNRRTDRIKNAPTWLKLLLSILSGVGFAGFSLTSSMTAILLITHPSLINQIDKIPAMIFSTPQPSYVWAFGITGATITIFIVTLFMMKFSFEHEINKKNQQKSSHSILTKMWIGTSLFLNTFVAGAGYFKGTAWHSLLKVIGAPSFVFYSFGLLMLSSLSAMCLPMFSDPSITKPLDQRFMPSKYLSKKPLKTEKHQRLGQSIHRNCINNLHINQDFAASPKF